MTLQQRRDAANKAVSTLRYRCLEKCANFPEFIHLVEQIKIAEYAYTDNWERESFISKNIGPTTYKSFTRFGDRNSITPGLILYWIRNGGTSLDEQAMHMSNDYGRDIMPDELAIFMAHYDRGMNTFPEMERINELKKAFRSMAGFNYDHPWLKKHLVFEDFREDLPF